MQNVLKSLRSRFSSVRKSSRTYRKKTASFVEHRPFASFLTVLGVLFVLIVIGNILRKPPAQPPVKAPVAKKIEAFRVGDSSRVSVQASVEKTGIITIYAQTPGVVQNIYRSEGQRVGQGGTVAYVSANYVGSNPASVGTQIASRNAEYQSETYDAQKDAVSKQRNIALKSYDQQAKLREITRKSLGDTGNLIAFNQRIIDSLRATLKQAETNSADAETILGLQGQISQAQGVLDQMSIQYKQNDYASSDEQAPKEITDDQKELTYRQLELQDKSIDLQRDIASLNVRLARVNEALYFPASPCAGIVERVYITVGDTVNPGDKIATIKADRSETVLTAMVDQAVASKYQISEISIVKFRDGTSAQIPADYVPADATDGTLTAVRFILPEEYSSKVSNKGYVSVALPLGQSAGIGESIHIPLDAIYQTQDSSYIFIARPEGKGRYIARTKEVLLGEVSGSFVRVKRGIGARDVVIVSRFVQDGDLVAF